MGTIISAFAIRTEFYRSHPFLVFFIKLKKRSIVPIYKIVTEQSEQSKQILKNYHPISLLP